MGVEPTGAGITAARTVLKTGRTTGFHPPPCRVVAYAQPGAGSTHRQAAHAGTSNCFPFHMRNQKEMDRFKSGGGLPFYYWLLAGMLIGILIGWFFSGFINMILRFTLFFGVIAVVGLVIYLWQKTKSTSSETASKPGSDIPEGSWRNIDPSGGK